MIVMVRACLEYTLKQGTVHSFLKLSQPETESPQDLGKSLPKVAL